MRLQSPVLLADPGMVTSGMSLLPCSVLFHMGWIFREVPANKNRSTVSSLRETIIKNLFFFLFNPLRRERPLSLGIFPSSGGTSLIIPDSHAKAETPGTEGWRFTDSSQPRSNTSLKVGVWVPPRSEYSSIYSLNTFNNLFQTTRHRPDDSQWCFVNKHLMSSVHVTYRWPRRNSDYYMNLNTVISVS